MMGLFDKSRVNDLRMGLDTLSVKNNVIARNIANQSTPKYKSTKIVFSEVMQEHLSGNDATRVKLSRTNARHLSVDSDNFDPRTMVRFQNNPSIRNDGNDVNVDYEMSQQADSEMRYQLLAELVGKKFTGLKENIKTRS